jgi:hypothetical protein
MADSDQPFWKTEKLGQMTKAEVTCLDYPRLRRRLVQFLFAACLLAVAQPCGAQTAPSLHKIIRDLDERMTSVGEVSGKLSKFDAAVSKARVEIAQSLAGGDRAKLLAERDSSGKTPLIAAAAAGYFDIVAEILLAPEARSTIEETDSSDLTAWDRANLASHQAAWVCNPGIMRNVMLYVPLLVVRPYYKHDESPYVRTRRVLEGAGASADMERVKRAWLTVCKYQLVETRKKVEASDDLLLLILEEGDRTLEILFPGINNNGNGE